MSVEGDNDDPAAALISDAAGNTSGAPASFDDVLNQVAGEKGQGLQQQSTIAGAMKSPLQKNILDPVLSAGYGVDKALVETANTVGDMLGLPKGNGVMETPFISDIYKNAAELDRQSGANQFISSTSQFVTGLVGVGKVMDAVKLGQVAAKGGNIGKMALEVFKGGAASALVFDPHQERLSNLIEQYPALQNPVTQYLAADPNDTGAEGRLKAALEGAGLDLAISGTLGLAIRAFKFTGRAVRGEGSAKEAQEAVEQLQEAVQQQTAEQHPAVQQKLPPARNVINEASPVDPEQLGRGRPPNGSPQQMATAINKDIEPTAEASGKLPPTTNLLDNERMAQPVKPVAGGPKVNKPPVAPPVDDRTAIADTIVQTARDRGQFKGQPPTKEAIAEATAKIEATPKIETNGIGFRVIKHADMGSVGKPFGIDTSNWLGSANYKSGEIIISDKVLAMPPARQAEIISHEIGHTLQRSFEERVPKAELQALHTQMRAASKELRPGHWNNATENAVRAKTTAHKDQVAKTMQYLNSHEELFADSFSLWKTNPQRFREIAPDVAAKFDAEFAPWIDVDLTTFAGNTRAAQKAGAVGKPVSTVGTPAQVQTQTKGAADQVAAETATPRMQPEDGDITSLLDSYKADQQAIVQYGDRETAIAAGHRFGQSNLPWQKLQGEEAYRQFHDRVAGQFKDTLDQLKGEDVLRDERVDALVAQRVKLFNEDPAEVLGEIQAAGHNANSMVANMEAAFAIANKAADDLYQSVIELDAGNLSRFGGDEQAARRALGDRLAIYVEAIGSAQSMRSAAGRALRRNRSEFRITPEFLKSVKSLDPDQIASIMRQSKGDPAKLAKIATPGFMDRAQRAAGTMFANNLLWNWKTHVSNLIGNAFMLATSPAMRAVGSFAVRGAEGSDVRTTAIREYRYMLSSMSDAIQYAKDAYMRGDSIMDPHNVDAWKAVQATTGAGAPSLREAVGLTPVQTLNDVVGNGYKSIMFGLGQPVRVLGMVDEFMKQTSYRASILSKASLDADKLGLGTADYQAFLQKRLDNAFDADGVATDAEAIYDAQVRTFQQPLLDYTAGKKTTDYLNRLGPWARFIVPFQKTPINLFRFSQKLTPGLNLMQREYRDMLSGKLGASRQADAFGQMMFGVAAASTIGAMAYNGQITGGPPSDPSKRGALADTGWQPYSVVLTNPDGSHTYVPFNRLDPIGMTMGIVADVVQIASNDEEGSDAERVMQVATSAVVAIIKNATSRTYLQSISQTIDAINDPERSVPKWAGTMASNLIPMSSALRNYNPDPVLREARGFVDTVMAGLPGFSTKLPPRRDAFGEVIFRSNSMVYADHPGDIVNAEQERLLSETGFGVTPPVAQPKAGVDLRQTQVMGADGKTPTSAFDRLQELSGHPPDQPTMKDALAKEIMSDQYKLLPDGDSGTQGTKLWALMRIVSKYRANGLKLLLKDNPDLRTQLGERQRAAREAYRSNLADHDDRQSRIDNTVAAQVRSFNEAYGIK